MTIIGFVCSLFSSATGMLYLVYKLMNGNSFEVGIAPIVIGFFFMSSFQLILLDILGNMSVLFLQKLKIVLMS
jgi:polyisoprenyl-phosphate glycosyltransferase